MNSNELSNFDNLPNAAHVDVHTVAALFGCKTPTIWLRLRRGEIPAPRKFGAHTRWQVGMLREALKGDKPECHLTPESSNKQVAENNPRVIGQNLAASPAACPSGKNKDPRRIKNAKLEKEEGQQ